MGLHELLDSGGFPLAEAADRGSWDARTGLDRATGRPIPWRRLAERLQGGGRFVEPAPRLWLGPQVRDAAEAERWLRDWAELWCWSRRVRRRIPRSQRVEWTENPGGLCPTPAALAHALELDPGWVAGTWADFIPLGLGILRWAGWARSPWVDVDPTIRPGFERSRAQEQAIDFLDRMPESRFGLLVTDDPLAVHLFSPLPRDLQRAWPAWATRDPEVPTELAEALRTRPRDPDLWILSAHRAVGQDPDLVAERDSQEQAHGLTRHPWAAGPGVTAWIVPREMAGPERRVWSPGSGNPRPVAVLAGPGGAMAQGWFETLLDSGRVEQVALSLGADLRSDGPVIPDGVSDAEDAVGVDAGPAAGDRVHWAGWVGLDPGGPFPPELMRWLRRLRRAQLLQGSPEGWTLNFYPALPGLRSRRVQLQAARLAAGSLLPAPGPAPRSPNRPMGRFRA